MDAQADQRHWLLTWSTYGTWVPEGEREGAGSGRLVAGRVAGPAAGRAYWDEQRERAAAARRLLREPPVWLTRHDAELILESFRDTAAHHDWVLYAVAVMPNHLHIVVSVAGDPDPSTLVRDFKAYASRALNQDRGYEPGVRGRWWTRSAATRPLRLEAHVAGAVDYVRKQQDCLALHPPP
jgi:REP element-mobilizing transposase RayT